MKLSGKVDEQMIKFWWRSGDTDTDPDPDPYRDTDKTCL